MNKGIDYGVKEHLSKQGREKRKTQRFSGAKKGHVMEEDQHLC